MVARGGAQRNPWNFRCGNALKPRKGRQQARASVPQSYACLHYQLHCQPGGTSQEPDVSGRVPCFAREARDFVRREIPLGVSERFLAPLRGSGRFPRRPVQGLRCAPPLATIGRRSAATVSDSTVHDACSTDEGAIVRRAGEDQGTIAAAVDRVVDEAVCNGLVDLALRKDWENACSGQKNVYTPVQPRSGDRW